MVLRISIIWLVWLFGTFGWASRGYTQDLPSVPPLKREYRGVWVATVANIDWPSRPGLDSQDQRNEALRILDKAAQLKMNVIVLQVRTSCDALYQSQLEPWSYFLTGTQGRPPEPFYDPLEFWIREAHLRGLELHAWFNPFRAKNTGQTYVDCEQHVSHSLPDLVKRYGNDKTSYLWLDPGEAVARQHSLAVFLDVLSRYDVDGIHIDDYFYPYPVDDLPFPDEPAWIRYQSNGGQLDCDDWRRDSMNQFIRQLYAEIKRIKPHVKFGISPFGIWKPGYPASVAGFSQHDKLYADARLWLNEGWCDYYTPQLYWPISAPQQSFPALLNWWAGENKANRHLAPGIYTGRIGNKTKGYTVDEVINQIYVARHSAGSSGVIHFSMKTLLEDREGVCQRIQSAYADPAVPPALNWIDDQPPSSVEPKLVIQGDQATVSWTGQPGVRWWRLVSLRAGKWQEQLLPADQTSSQLPAMDLQAVGLSALDYCGNEGQISILHSKDR